METLILIVPYIVALMLAISNFPSRLLWDRTERTLDVQERCVGVRWASTVDILTLPLLATVYAAMHIPSWYRQRQTFDVTATGLFIALLVFYGLAVVWALRAVSRAGSLHFKATQNQGMPRDRSLSVPKLFGILAPGVLDVWVHLGL